MENNLYKTNQHQLILWEPADGRVFESGAYALDTETELIDEKQPHRIPRMVAAAVSDGDKAYLLTTKTIAEFLRIHAELTVVMHNAPFDLAVIDQEIAGDFDVYSLVEKGRVRDTQILHRLFALATTGSGEWNGSSLKECCQKYLGIEMEKDLIDESGYHVQTNFGRWKNRLAELPVIYREYLLNDVIATYQLYQKLQSLYTDLGEKIALDRPFGFIDRERLIDARKQYGALTHHIQLKAAIVLDTVKRHGLHVDTTRLATFRRELQEEQKEILKGLLEYGYRPGEGSSTTLQRILQQEEEKYDNIRFPRTKSGKISTTSESLEPYEANIPFIGLYLRSKAIEKLLGSFLDKMQSGVLHPTFDVLKNTGRTSAFGDLSSQNLPRDERVRSLFVPSPGHVFIDADYSGVEMVTLAQAVLSQFGGRSSMADAINARVDLHSLIASRLTGKAEGKISKEDRRKAKAVNFGFPGGMGARTFREYAKANYGIDMTEAEATQHREIWLDTFPEMRRLLDESGNLGEDIARLLKINCIDYSHATGKHGIDKNETLGWMARKVFGEASPQTNGGRHYTEAERDYFWGCLDTVVNRLAQKHRDSVRARNPSPGLVAAVSDLASQAEF